MGLALHQNLHGKGIDTERHTAYRDGMDTDSQQTEPRLERVVTYVPLSVYQVLRYQALSENRSLSQMAAITLKRALLEGDAREPQEATA